MDSLLLMNLLFLHKWVNLQLLHHTCHFVGALRLHGHTETAALHLTDGVFYL